MSMKMITITMIMMISRLSSAKSTHTVEIYEPADWQKATTTDDDGDDDDDDDGGDGDDKANDKETLCQIHPRL